MYIFYTHDKIQGDSHRIRPIYLAVYQTEQNYITLCAGSDYSAPPGTTRFLSMWLTLYIRTAGTLYLVLYFTTLFQ
jgi:hypothetical protein